MLFPWKDFVGVKEQLLTPLGIEMSRAGDQTNSGLLKSKAGRAGAVGLCEVPGLVGTGAGPSDTREDKELRIRA